LYLFPILWLFLFYPFHPFLCLSSFVGFSFYAT
jgi:hypothetical protein